MQFIDPSSLWLLLLLPPLAVTAVWLGARRNASFAHRFGEIHLVSRFSQLTGGRQTLFKAVCVFLAVSAAVVALARPTLNDRDVTVPAGTVDVVSVIDVSRSMAIESYPGKTGSTAGTRLDMAKTIVQQRLMPALAANKLSLVSYSGQAVTQGFLSTDMNALTWVLENAITIGGAPGDGTNVTTGLRNAIEELALDSKPGHTRVIVLFTDGDFYDSAADIATVTAALKQEHIQLVIVGLGSAEAQPIPIDQLAPQDRSQFYGQKYYQNAAGQIERIPFNYQTVNNLKNEAGARFIRIENASDFDIGNLFSGHAVTHTKGTHELFFIPLALALIFFALQLLTHNERFASWREHKQRWSGREIFSKQRARVRLRTGKKGGE
jgi:von Willebrand factor type A domain